jgi:hypothetical protein
MPRNQGYAPMRSSSSATTPGSVSDMPPPVIYARIDPAGKRNYNNSTMLNQAQTTVPLLISSGGVSPSSIMNTSCESSASGGSTSRLAATTIPRLLSCGNIHKICFRQILLQSKWYTFIVIKHVEITEKFWS